MPLNTLRLNHAPSTHPNDRIVFVKPLPLSSPLQPDYEHASTFLHAIAAQCLPIMKSHHLSVTTLEEHEPNREFIGRNFNNGEIIQLVLRRRDGSWLSLNQVQMVMMHELAHNLHMNHGKGFWAQRNKYAEQMMELRRKRYTGEGFWGEGRHLQSLERHAGNTLGIGAGMEVEGLCGGTYRSRRGQKRKRGTAPDLTWKEKRDRRIEKKFGKNGVALGADEDIRGTLEPGKRAPSKAKPRVANSKRGRELRATAALARFEQQNKEPVEKNEMKNSDSDPDSDQVDEKPALDINGAPLLDSKGLGMVQVAPEEEIDQSFIKQELDDFGLSPEPQQSNTTCNQPLRGISQTKILRDAKPVLEPEQRLLSNALKQESPPASPPKSTESLCPICTTSNSSSAATCVTCVHVLNTSRDPRSWRCSKRECASSGYMNSGDYSRCGACGLAGDGS